jgi:hypothetical protein
VRELNTLPWESTKDLAAYTLVLDQMYVTLDTNFYKSSLVYLTNLTTGDTCPMTEIPYVPFKRQFWRTNTDLSNHGTPRFYTFFNYEKTRRILFDCAPDSTAVSTYNLTVEYYKRLPLITSAIGDNHPDIPDYLENVILNGAYKRLCAHLSDGDGMKIYAALEKEALEHARRIDIMQPDADHRFRLANAPNYGLVNSRFYGFSPY